MLLAERRIQNEGQTRFRRWELSLGHDELEKTFAGETQHALGDVQLKPRG